MIGLYLRCRNFFASNGKNVAGFIIAHRVLNMISYAVDALHIYLLIWYGFWTGLVVITILFFIICWTTVLIHDIAISYGYDFLQIDRLRNFAQEYRANNKKKSIQKFTRWLLERKYAIFWIGSLWLEPDIVTLLIRRHRKITLESTLITLSSTILCVSVWNVIFYLGVQGYNHFKAFII